MITQVRIFYACDLETLENRVNKWVRGNSPSTIQVKRTELIVSETAFIVIITYETEE